jgi:hypothetical protein
MHPAYRCKNDYGELAESAGWRRRGRLMAFIYGNKIWAISQPRLRKKGEG